jgi:hypothetical protein
MKIDLKQVEDVELADIDTSDYPDFCDAYVYSATYKGREATEDECDALTEDKDFLYEQINNHLY